MPFTATVVFDAPADPTFVTAVLVSEVSEDYSEGYGQLSEPGGTTVKIGNIKPSTRYYFQAYRVNPDTWERSAISEEIMRETEAWAEQQLIELPPLLLGNVAVSIIVSTVD